MAVQTQVSNLAAIMGGRISAANEQHKDKPVDKGFQRLPPGMKNGVAKLQVMEVGQYQDDKNGPGTKGKHFFRAAAVVVFSGNVATPHEHGGVRVLNMQTSQFASLSDMPAVSFQGGTKPATKFEDNFADFQNIFKMFGVVCPETKATDPGGQKTWAFYQAAMKALTDPKRPRYVSFSTSTLWKKRRANESQEQFDQREGTSFENWHEEVQWKGITNPADSVNVISNGHGVGSQPHPTDTAPVIGADGLPNNPPPTNSSIHRMAPDAEVSIEDKVAALVASSMGMNEDAQKELSQMAFSKGWTQEEIESASWEEVGTYALNEPASDEEVPANEIGNIGVGSKWKFTKRDRNGAKIVDDKGNVLPSSEVEITSVDIGNKTCTVKMVKGGREVVDIRTKKPIQVKFEWLES